LEKQQAERLVRDTFQAPFDKGRLIFFVKSLLNHIEEKPFTYQGNYVPAAYQHYVSRLERMGKYADGEHIVELLIVSLKKETSIERARSMQRNFIAWYLNGSRGGELKDAALVAFVSPNPDDWRFSLIKMDYRFEEGKDGRMKVKEEFTPARRWSFLVGTHENSHTAQSRLAPIIADDGHNPTLSELEEAFNIEKVTKEFFEKYRELFFRVNEELDIITKNNSSIKDDFQNKGVSTVDFTKKLLGQIVFLYFLQKKGWFGVARDGEWGSGSRHFLRELFDRKHGQYKNFFNDILEPLFYEALRYDRSDDDDYYSKLNCRIPFLNGGLFDPIGGYDWVHQDVLLPNGLFSNATKTKEGDTGNGILDIFDRYNFTVKEDEPLEKEVAVDPEMLGKVFENLLEVKDRKSKGTYYTPREIVHYMCQQSLIHYLCNTLPSAPLPIIHDIEMLIHYGEDVTENEARVMDAGKETGRYYHKLPESIRQNADLIDKKLADIQVCDPAIGSGAFPVGMMAEIVRVRTVLSAYLKDDHRTPYMFKRHCIQNSLYGVDIDQGAVEIAKLRLWLSLVVDEDDIKQIKPLPNLDYKIVCGNSLGSVRRDVLNDHLFAELERLKGRFFDETSPGQKKAEKARIGELISKLTHNDAHFDYAIFFSEVFDHGGGFDIVIANPPYVRQEGIKELKPLLCQQFGKFYCGTADLYTYFYKRGLENLKPGGHLCFIAPNKFMRAAYGKNTRVLLTTDATPKTVIDFGDLPIFDATTYPSILLLQKRRPAPNEKTIAATFTDRGELERIDETLALKRFAMPISALKADGWTLEQPEVLALMEKLRAAGTPLGEYVKGRFYYDIKTGLNEAFVIDDETKDRLIAEDPKSAELIKPWLRGRDIKRWKAEWAGLYLITIPSSANKEWSWSDAKTENQALKKFQGTYPAVHQHLSRWEKNLRVRDDQGKYFGELRSCVYYREFEQPKIIIPAITNNVQYAIDYSRHLSNDKTSICVSECPEFMAALLNSELLWWLMQNQAATRSGGFYEFKPMYVTQLPIAPATPTQQAPIISLVQAILADPDSPDVPRLEKQIDQLVYQLYNLTPDEIAIVEGSHGPR
jgi:type I restriction-modification system DNA methylase subunit